MRIVPVFLVTSLLLAPFAASKTMTAPYDFVSYSLSQYGVGNAGCMPVVQCLSAYGWDAGTGKIQMGAIHYNEGRTDFQIGLGHTYYVNSGATLSWYYADVTVRAHVQGLLWCSSLMQFTEASLSLQLEKYWWDGSSWQNAGSWLLESWACTRGGHVTLDTDIVRTATLFFDAGESYALQVRALGWARASGDYYESTQSPPGQKATFEFLDGLFGPGGITIQAIEVTNPSPVNRYADNSVWYVTNLLSGTQIRGTACDYDGAVAWTHLQVAGTKMSGFGSSHWLNTWASCVTDTFTTKFQLPGNYAAYVEAWDDEDAWARDNGVTKVLILPTGPLSSPVLPVPEKDLGDTIVVDAATDGGGNVTGTRVTGTRILEGDTLSSLPSELAVHLARVVLNRPAARATIMLDGELVWEGGFEQVGPNWWDVEPLSEDGPSPAKGPSPQGDARGAGELDFGGTGIPQKT
jgi:hypothetical protein